MRSESFPAEVSHRFLCIGLIASLAFAVATAVTFLIYETQEFGRSLAISAFLLALAAIAWRNRERPVLAITDEEIQWAPLFFWNPQCIRISDIEEIDVASKWKILIWRKSRRRVVLRLRRISPPQRERARNALLLLQSQIASRAK